MIPYNFKLNIDLISDLQKVLKSSLQKMDFLNTSDIDAIPLKDIPYVFFELTNKLVEPSPRIVHFSAQFRCKEELRSNLDTIVKKIENGEDLTPHLSRTISNLKFSDGLLYDWGIHHLHLGITIEEHGFAKRGGDLLYILFTDSDAYIIDIMNHGSFEERRLLEIIHTNWPQAISRYKINGVSMSGSGPSSDEIRNARRSGSNLFMKVNDGTVYAPLGGGMSTARTSMRSTISADRIHRALRDYENHIRKNAYLFSNEVKEVLGCLPPELNFKLSIEADGRMYAKELLSSVCFLIEQ